MFRHPFRRAIIGSQLQAVGPTRDDSRHLRLLAAIHVIRALNQRRRHATWSGGLVLDRGFQLIQIGRSAYIILRAEERKQRTQTDATTEDYMAYNEPGKQGLNQD
jgi:hypothetical protein